MELRRHGSFDSGGVWDRISHNILSDGSLSVKTSLLFRAGRPQDGSFQPTRSGQPARKIAFCTILSRKRYPGGSPPAVAPVEFKLWGRWCNRDSPICRKGLIFLDDLGTISILQRRERPVGFGSVVYPEDRRLPRCERAARIFCRRPRVRGRRIVQCELRSLSQLVRACDRG